jgi:hypothetical protein
MHLQSTFARPACRVVAFMLALAWLAGSASAQSLGELARQEEARRKAIKSSGKVYTNDSVRSDPAAPPSGGAAAAAPASSAPAPPPSPSGTQPAAGEKDKESAKPSAADPKKAEASWRQRVQAERDALQRAQTFADALQSRINGLSTDFAARDDPAQRSVIATDRQKALAELDRVKQEIQQHTKALAAIQEEARKAGIPAGWVR